MKPKKRTWRFWVSRSLFVLLLLGSLWLINLIWFRPFNIRHFYDRIFIEFALESPEVITTMGIPVLYDLTKDELNDISVAKQKKNLQKLRKDYQTLMSYDFSRQSEANQLNTAILQWYMNGELDGEPFFYHGYPVNQMAGIQNELPSFMVNFHKLRNARDIEAYITRLSLFQTQFEQVVERLRLQEGHGIVPPRFVIERVMDEIKRFMGAGESENAGEDSVLVRSNILYTHFVEKINEIGGLSKEEKDDFTNRVEEVIQSNVFGAYQMLAGFLENLYAKATTDDGVWKLPNGDAYYQYMLRKSTTTNLTPVEVHQLGLQEVNRITAEMWTILKSQGYSDTTKTIGAVMQALSAEDRFLYPENEEGRASLLRDYKRILDEISAGIDSAFDIRPRAGIDVKREPEFREAGQAKAHYEGPSMDGSRGGVFIVNLRKVSEHPMFGMKTLAYHEGIPGHHFQIAIQTELSGVPIFRTVIPFTAYMEGWALYAEQLAWELGFYKNDPFGNLGRLQAEMWRAVRLVVDTGIHFRKWTREDAIEYMVSNTGMTTTEVTTEIERYIVWPGQACSYKIGMLKILELREKAKKELGVRFDLKRFHNVILQRGPMPLEILEKVVNEYIEDVKSEEDSRS